MPPKVDINYYIELARNGNFVNAPLHIRNNIEHMKIMVQHNPAVYINAAPKLKRNIEFIMYVLSYDNLQIYNIPADVFRDRSNVLTIFSVHRTHGCTIPKFKDDYEVALACVSNCGVIYNTLSNRLKKNRDIIMATISNDGSMIFPINNSSSPISIDKEILLAAATFVFLFIVTLGYTSKIILHTLF